MLSQDFARLGQSLGCARLTHIEGGQQPGGPDRFVSADAGEQSLSRAQAAPGRVKSFIRSASSAASNRDQHRNCGSPESLGVPDEVREEFRARRVLLAFEQREDEQ